MKSVHFKTIDITNFLSVGKTQHIDFSDGITAIFGINHDKSNDTNGVGKSTILSAVCFALYGDPIKNIKREEVVNRIAGGKCEVKLDFDVAENGKTIEYSVSRGVKPSFCKLSRDGEDISLSGMPETTKRIGEVIGTSLVMFKNTCLMSLEDNIPFARQKAAEKREFIEGVFDLGFIKEMAKAAKLQADKFMAENTEANSHIDEIKNQIALYEKGEIDWENDRKIRLVSFDSKISEFEQKKTELEKNIIVISESEIKSLADEKTKVDKLVDTFDEKERKLNAERTEIIRMGTEVKGKIALQKQKDEDHAKELDDIKKTAAEYDIDNYEEFLEKNTEESCSGDILTLEGFIMKIDNKLNELHGDLAQCKKNIDDLKEKGNICIACGRPFPENDIAERDLKIRQEETKMKDVLENIQKLKAGKLRANEKMDAVKDRRYCQDVLRRMVAKYNSYVAVDIGAFEEQIKDLRTKAVENGNELKKISEDKVKISALVDTVTKKQMELNSKISANDGIKSHIATVILEIENINKEKNELVNSVNKFTEYKNTAKENLAIWEKKRDETEHSCNVYRNIREILSDDGFRSYMVKQYISVLNNQINKYLVKLDAPIRLEFDEYLDDKIIDQLTGDTCSYDSLSGGEKRRVDIACLLSFSDLRRLRGDVLFSHAFYDEILDSALSPGACGKLMSILKDRFDEEGESSMIITHKQEMQDDPNIKHKILVEKIGGVSRLSNG